MTQNRTILKTGTTLLAFGWAVSMLTGCQTNRQQLQSFLETAHTPVGSTEYRVMPPDVLSITARPAEEYKNLSVRLGPDGKAHLPLIGEFPLAGKTTTQIAGELADLLMDYYQDVQVTVAVTNYNSQKFYVFGQVSHPGAYAYTGSDSLLSALAQAQPTNLAMPEKVQLVRSLDPAAGGFNAELDEEGNVKANAKKLTVNLYDMVKDGDMSANVLLASNDVIFVPANPMAEVGLALQNVLFPIRPAVEAVGSPARAVAVAP